MRGGHDSGTEFRRAERRTPPQSANVSDVNHNRDDAQVVSSNVNDVGGNVGNGRNDGNRSNVDAEEIVLSDGDDDDIIVDSVVKKRSSKYSRNCGVCKIKLVDDAHWRRFILLVNDN